ncbi:MAG: CdvA-like protein [Candidatus Bathyarchaeota archaeon]|nr:CdvA-like protein [Candidatus Bathyarchaeota archaeon]
MISWKHSFRRLNEEYEIAKKKKQALDNLLENGRISQSTHEIFEKEIAEAIAEIEKQKRDLLDKMNSKISELESQIKTLEVLVANYEIQHVTGEVEEEVYQREINLLSVGLDTARKELDALKEALNQLSENVQILTTDVTMQPEIKPQLQETEVEVTKVENVEIKETDSPQAPQEQIQEKPQITEESPPTEKTES